MSQRIILACDVCRSEDRVATVIISRPGAKSVEIDLCDEHWQKMLAAFPEARPTAKAAGRPQVKMRKVTLPPQP